MTRTLDVITEIIRNPKHPFRKADDRPVKAQKHRYERRKIKEFIRLSDWGEEKTAQTNLNTKYFKANRSHAIAWLLFYARICW